MDTAGALTSATGAGAKWGCAIPITRAMTIAQQIESGAPSPYIESGHRGVLGVVCAKPGAAGCVVTAVAPAEAAATAGLKAGDVITKVGGVAVTSATEFNVVMQDRRPGDAVAVTWRNPSGGTHSAVAVLSAGPPA
jgi:S1-C subfamily serine protease